MMRLFLIFGILQAECVDSGSGKFFINIFIWTSHNTICANNYKKVDIYTTNDSDKDIIKE